MTKLVRDMVERYGAHPGSPQAGHAAAIKALWQLAYRETSTLAYADAFRLIMIVLVIATLLVPLMRKVVATGAASTEAH
jgi:DHA2 family multidrug resistance protein